MWLLCHDAILTKDNIVKKNGMGMYNALSVMKMRILFIFFQCTMARYIFFSSYVWSLIANVVGADCRPCSFEQY